MTEHIAFRASGWVLDKCNALSKPAHRRGDLFEKRRLLMDEWANYCAKPASASGDKVVPIGSGRKKG